MNEHAYFASFSQRRMIRLNDKWFRLVGIPVLALLGNWIFYDEINRQHNQTFWIDWIFALLEVSLLWTFSRYGILTSRRRYPNLSQTRPQIIFQVLWFLGVTAALRLLTTFLYDVTQFWSYAYTPHPVCLQRGGGLLLRDTRSRYLREYVLVPPVDRHLLRSAGTKENQFANAVGIAERTGQTLNSVDYLLKPIQETALRKALQKFRQLRQTYGGATTIALPIDELIRQISERQPAAPAFRERFLVHVGQRLLPIDSAEVAYYYSTTKLTFLKPHSDNQYMLNYSLDELEKSLAPRQFYRANRQFIVSHKAVQKLHLHFNSKLKVDLRPVAEEAVMISREKAMTFRHWLGE